MKYLFAFLFLIITCSSQVFSANVTAESKKEVAMFTLHQRGDSSYLEIPFKLLERDFLFGTRIIESGSPNNKLGLVAGQRVTDPVLIRFVHDNGQLLVVKPIVDKVCYPKEAFREAFDRNFKPSVVSSMKIEMLTDSSLWVNYVPLFLEEIKGLDPFNEKYRPGSIRSDLTKLIDAKVCSNNMEVSVRYVYDTTKDPLLLVMRKSLLLLPEKEMLPRLSDSRVGYDFLSKEVYSSKEGGSQKVEYITRFNLYPRAEDVAKMKKGVLVEPEKPIVFYIDSSFPLLWQKAIAKGIEDWQAAFEEIGFKNAIVARVYPDSPEFDPYDIRNNCFRLVVSNKSNAMGVHWVDPRSGEILQADVLFFSDVVKLLQKWYFLQTGAVNPDARKTVLDDETLQKLIRYSAAHEIGHCLGLLHNFGASYNYDTDSLRSASFTKKYGTTPSIMDYARFNYIAQPQDKNVSLLPPHLGIYDKFAIRMGYKPIFNVDNAYYEKKVWSKWLEAKDGDFTYIFRKMSIAAVSGDPSLQSADLGNDLVKSSAYGIDNLRFLLKHLHEWFLKPGDDYTVVADYYDDIFQENFKYLDRVIPLIGGAYTYNPLVGSSYKRVNVVNKKEGIKAVEFVLSELFNQSSWLNTSSTMTFAGNQIERLVQEQKKVVDKLLMTDIFKNMYLFDSAEGGLTADEYLKTVSNMILDIDNPDIYVKNIQKSYLNKLKALKGKELNVSYGILFADTVQNELQRIKLLLDKRNSVWYKSLKDKI